MNVALFEFALVCALFAEFALVLRRFALVIFPKFQGFGLKKPQKLLKAEFQKLIYLQGLSVVAQGALSYQLIVGHAGLFRNSHLEQEKGRG